MQKVTPRSQKVSELAVHSDVAPLTNMCSRLRAQTQISIINPNTLLTCPTWASYIYPKNTSSYKLYLTQMTHLW